ncbi:MAG: metallophosphoesterase family protein [Anaerolineaceae bacterium]|nr:metallophosphoesterase family protein [Anaerolineaceae bacterium]
MSAELYRIGVIADTHIPDRVGALHPDILPTFKEQGVDLIIHAGDISSPDVIRQLEQIAPVQAVQGNRDWWRFKNLPAVKVITIKEVKILITHGHGHLLSYIWDKFPYWILGYKFERFVQKFSRINQKFDIAIFGHSHRPENRWVEGRLYFNPGSAYDPLRNQSGPSIGVMEIGEGKSVSAEIIRLRGIPSEVRKKLY